MKYMEVELKFNAEDISLTDFVSFCESRNPLKTVTASGWDHFYAKVGDLDSFCRLRSGPDCHQLTFKRKTTDKNNFTRVEHNIDLLPSVTKDQIEALLTEFGYEYNRSLFKNCFIYKYDVYTQVFYVVYDSGMKELGRYVEIEMSEEHQWGPGDECWNHLTVLEKLAKPLGISPQGRIKKSLFELYRKVAT